MIAKKKFTVEGFELREKEVKIYVGQSARIIVPRGWKKVVIIKVE